MKTIIIEDEKPARDLIKSYLKDLPTIELAGEFDNGFTGLKGIIELKPELVFLDVQMPKLTGFELLELLDEKPKIIFTTAYEQYAIKAFEQSAVDYLLKPFSKQRFEEAVQKAIGLTKESGTTNLKELSNYVHQNKETLNRIAVKSGSNIKILPIQQVYYLEAQDDYVMIYTENERFMKKATMAQFEKSLPENIFVRVHRSYLINLSFIGQLEKYEKDSYLLLMKNKSKIKVSRQGYKKLKEKLNI